MNQSHKWYNQLLLGNHWFKVYLFILLCISVIQIDAIAALDPETCNIPREQMPGKVYECIQSSIKQNFKAKNDDSLLRANLNGLEEIYNKLLFPDFEQLEFFTLHHSSDESLFLYRWGHIVNNTVCAIREDYTQQSFALRQFSKVQKLNFSDFLQSLHEKPQKILNAIAAGEVDQSNLRKNVHHLLSFANEREWYMWRTLEEIPPRNMPLLFQYAYLAASFDENELADRLTQILLYLQPDYFRGLFDRLASYGIQEGKSKLQSQNPFQRAFKRWKATAEVYQGSQFSGQLNQLIADVKPQVEQEHSLLQENTDVDSMPQSEKIEYYIDRLQYTREHAVSNPAFYSLLSQCRPLIEMGRPAIPALIGHLDDTRLTLTVHQHLGLDGKVYRVHDAVGRCINKILAFSPTFSDWSTSPQNRDEYLTEYKQKMKAWWENAKELKREEWYLSQLEATPIRKRIQLLNQIEEINSDAVDSIALLKTWAGELGEDGNAKRVEESQHKINNNLNINQSQKNSFIFNIKAPPRTDNDLCTIANALAERGDFSLLPRVRNIFKVNLDKGIYHYPFVGYLAKYGEQNDFRLLYRETKKEMQDGFDPGSSKIVGPVFSGISSSTHRLTIPLLVLFLDCHQQSGVGSNWYGDGGFSYADKAMRILIERTGHNEGFLTSMSPIERKHAIQKWKQWWESHAKDQYEDLDKEMLAK